MVCFMKLKSSHLSYGFLGAFLATVFVLQWQIRSSYPSPLWMSFGLILAIGILGCLQRKTRSVSSIVIASVLGVSIAILSVMKIAHEPNAQTVDFYAPAKRVTITGRIAEEPDRRPTQTKYVIETQSVRLGTGAVIPVSGKVLASDFSGWPRFYYGQEVTAAGALSHPGVIEDFHYDKYLSRYGIYSVMVRTHVEKTGDGHPNRIFSFLYALKERFEARINRLYPEPEASLLAGILTGSRQGLPEHVQKDFQRAGLTHVVAISGFNITIILSVIIGALFFVPLRLRLIPAVLGIVAFTFFVGAGASVVRAAIMGILGLLALHTGRQKDIRLAILWTAFAMLLWNPSYLWYDAGFQLSFLAVIGLSELSPILTPVMSRIPETLGIRDSLQMTIAAQLTAVPLSIALFGNFSLIAPLANILIAPAVPLAMLFGFLGTIGSYLWFPLGQAISFLAYGCLQWMLGVSRILAMIPFAAVAIPKFHHVVIVLYYGCLIVVVWWIRRRWMRAE